MKKSCLSIELHAKYNIKIPEKLIINKSKPNHINNFLDDYIKLNKKKKQIILFE